MKKICFAAFVLALMASCKNLVPYSDALKTKYHLQTTDLMRVQFYVSDPVVLQRKVTDAANAQVVQGKVKIVNGESVEEVIIPRGTPGVLVRDSAGKMSISFEKNDDHFLRFGPNPDKRNRYVLLASDWRNRVGVVNYAGEQFYTSPESSDAELLIDLRRIEKFSKNERVAGGRKVN
ncbi:MAG: hypothetical protein U0T73_07895 [Chitinophagales bacterium]